MQPCVSPDIDLMPGIQNNSNRLVDCAEECEMCNNDNVYVHDALFIVTCRYRRQVSTDCWTHTLIASSAVTIFQSAFPEHLRYHTILHV